MPPTHALPCHGVHGYQTDVSWCGALRQAASRVASRGSACGCSTALSVMLCLACGLRAAAPGPTPRERQCCCCRRLYSPGRRTQPRLRPPVLPHPGWPGRSFSPAGRHACGLCSVPPAGHGSLWQGSWCGAAEMQAVKLSMCQMLLPDLPQAGDSTAHLAGLLRPRHQVGQQLSVSAVALQCGQQGESCTMQASKAGASMTRRGRPLSGLCASKQLKLAQLTILTQGDVLGCSWHACPSAVHW
jgi:hypothetical protein